jgi:hypothetical protein
MKTKLYKQEMVHVNFAARDINEICAGSVWAFVCFFGREWDSSRDGEEKIWALFVSES